MPGSTPVNFRGRQPSARVASVGINPSVREFLSRGGAELTGTQRRFESLSSLGIDSFSEATASMQQRVRQRCLKYFDGNPYMEWFDPMEHLVHAVTGASYFDGSACHMDIVQWATQPLWGQLDDRVRGELLADGRLVLVQQLNNPALHTIYVNGRTACEAVAQFIPLVSRVERFRGTGARRTFFRGVHGQALVVGCSSNVQEERLRKEERDDFMAWVIDECRRDLGELRTPPGEVETPPSPRSRS